MKTGALHREWETTAITDRPEVLTLWLSVAGPMSGNPSVPPSKRQLFLGPGRLRIHSELSFPGQPRTPARAELVREIPRAQSVRFIAHLQYELRRSERYLALCAGLKVPMSFELEGVESFGWTGDLTDVFLTSSQRWELPSELEGAYHAAEHLLSALPDDSYLGKAAENVGAATTAEDPDIRYVFSWNAIELLAKEHYLESHPTLPRGDATGCRPSLRNIREMGAPLIGELHDGVQVPDLDWLTYLRNGSAHGGLSEREGQSFDEYVERWDKADAIRDLAYELLINYLSRQRVIPPVPRPVHARVMVPSFRADWKIEPVDESPKLARKGTEWDG
jgi:hypothetical protein